MIFALLALLGGAPPPAPIPYAPTVAALLERHCVRCHSAQDQNGGLRLDSYAALARGGESGPAVIPGDADGSLLIQKIEHRDRPVMPPRKKLDRATIATLRAWIKDGARP
jgi:hypothetical protein